MVGSGSGSGMEQWSDPDPDPGSGIKHPGSATLGLQVNIYKKLFQTSNFHILKMDGFYSGRLKYNLRPKYNPFRYFYIKKTLKIILFKIF